MEYDQEFEDYFYNATCKQGYSYKDKMYQVWQAARACKPGKKVIELEGGMYFINVLGSTTQVGQERKNEVDAIKAAELMRKRDRLAAFVYEHCGYDYEFIEGSQDNFFIYYDDEQDIYDWAYEDGFPDLCKQYMPEATAIWLCEKLNTGEIVL